MHCDIANEFINVVKQAIEETQVDSMDPTEELRAIIACPDQSVGMVKTACSPGEFQRVNIDDRFNGLKDSLGRIILVLESPHDKEYVLRDEKWIAKGPACGCTGCQIREKFREIFKDKMSIDDYELILVNAIQYQCSLGRKLQGNKNFSHTKNTIVEKLLKMRIFRHELRKRISKVWRPKTNDFIINACSSYTRICCHVKNVITAITDRVVCGVPHPSSWMYSRNLETARNVINLSRFWNEHP